MDANGQRFHLLADARHWRQHGQTVYDPGCRTLRLASRRPPLHTPVDHQAFAQANSALDQVPRAVDPLDSVARWDEAAGAVVVNSPALPGDALLLRLDQRPSDLCIAADGVLYIALPDAVLMHDLRDRFETERVPSPGLQPWRLAAAAGGGVWVLDRVNARLARLQGRPLPRQTPPRSAYAPGVFRPEADNCQPPVLQLLPGVAWPADERPLAITAQPGPLLLLAWAADGAVRLRGLAPGGERLGPPLAVPDARYAYALAWLDDGALALRLPGRPEAPAIDLRALWAGDWPAAEPSADAGQAGDPLVAANAIPLVAADANPQVAAGANPLIPADADPAAPAGTGALLGQIYPLAAGSAEGPFAHGVQGPPRYPVAGGQAEPLLPLSIVHTARQGQAQHWRWRPDGQLDAQLLDSGQPGTVWHRLMAEAAIPPGTGFVAWLAATADPQPPADDDPLAWQPHAFGRDVFALAPDLLGPVPRAAWDRAPSELPGHPGLAPWSPEPQRRGLFGVLIQHSDRRVRTLQGRYLWLRIALHGDGRATPEIAALRAWASRFDYVAQYLPRLFHETEFGAAAQVAGTVVGRLDGSLVAALDAGGMPAGNLLAALVMQADAGLASADAASLQVQPLKPGQRWRLVDNAQRRLWHLVRQASGAGDVLLHQPQATPADFLARLLANFEGVLTTLEDRVAAAHVLTHPATVPEPQLDWLGRWVGLAFDPALPAERRRAWLAAAPRLARWHGTRRGLALALDLATGGAVAGGEVVVLEDFRLRRLLATLLGVDLSDDNDPLLPGLHRSGNSVVGDSLVLGEQPAQELMALFRADQASAAENDAARAFQGQLAHRATVFVHQAVQPQDLALIRRICALEAPAHVLVRVVNASRPLLVGVASLVGVDTYLGPPRPPRPAQVQVSALGLGDVVRQPPLLDPRMGGTVRPLAARPPPRPPLAGPPVADAGPDRVVPLGISPLLDGSGSRAAPGRQLQQFIWRRLPPED